MRDAVDEFVDDERCLGVKSRVGFVAEEILGVEAYGTGYGRTLLHAAAYLARVFHAGISQVDTFQAVHGTLVALLLVHGREHVQREPYVFQHRHAVEEGRTLEEHAHLTVQEFPLLALHGDHVTSVEENLSAGGTEEADDAAHQYGLSRAALPDDEVADAVAEISGDAPEHLLLSEIFMQVFYLYHIVIDVNSKVWSGKYLRRG